MEKREIIITLAIIQNDKKEYLLVQQQARDLGRLTHAWYPPGGHLERNESIEGCLKRELKEELDVEIKPIREIAILPMDIKGEIAHFWECKLVKGEPKSDSTIKKFGFFSGEDVKTLFLWPATRKFFEKYIWK